MFVKVDALWGFLKMIATLAETHSFGTSIGAYHNHVSLYEVNGRRAKIRDVPFRSFLIRWGDLYIVTRLDELMERRWLGESWIEYPGSYRYVAEFYLPAPEKARAYTEVRIFPGGGALPVGWANKLSSLESFAPVVPDATLRRHMETLIITENACNTHIGEDASSSYATWLRQLVNTFDEAAALHPDGLATGLWKLMRAQIVRDAVYG